MDARRRRLGTVGVAVWLTVALLAFASLSRAQLGPGQNAKPFTLETVEGKPVSLSDYLGKTPVLLAFISISCFECDETIPVMARAIDKYQTPGKLQVLFIALANKKGARWIEKYGKYDSRAPLLVEKISGDLLPTADDYGVLATPFFFLIGKDGKIRWTQGGRVDFDTLDAELQRVTAR